MQLNPFCFNGPVNDISFTARTEELSLVKGLMAAEKNCILLSHKAWGKTSLLQKAMIEVARANKKVDYGYLNLKQNISWHQFYQEYANAAMLAAAKNETEYLNLAAKAFASLRPEIFLDSENPANIRMSFDWEALDNHSEEVLHLPERLAELSRKKLIISLDSFHETCGLEDPLPALRLMRAVWAKHKRVCYCIAADAIHPFRTWVSEPSGPLFEFGNTAFLHPIPEPEWAEFITHSFSESGKFISNGNALSICSMAFNQPSYVQLIAHEVWTLTDRRASESILKSAVANILKRRDTDYRILVHNMPKSRLDYLRFLALHPAQKPTATLTLKYGLGNAQKVRRTMNFFEKKRILFAYKGGLRFSDPLFALWIKQSLFGIGDTPSSAKA